jgi:hypothetical protein
VKVGIEAVTVDTLHRVRIKRNAEAVGYALTYSRGKVEPVCMAAPGCGDDAPIFRIVDKTVYEVACSVCKQSGGIGRVLYLAEWRAVLCAPELGEINQGAELMENRPGG